MENCYVNHLNEINYPTTQPITIDELNLNLTSIVAKSKQRHAELAYEIENNIRRSSNNNNNKSDNLMDDQNNVSERSSRSRSSSREKHQSTNKSNSDLSPNKLETTHNADYRKDYYQRSHYSSQQQSFRLAYHILYI